MVLDTTETYYSLWTHLQPEGALKSMRISIEGNIGSGKSSLLRQLEGLYQVYPEPVDDWQPILSMFYAKPRRWSLQMNLQALLSFSKVPDQGVVVTERSPLSCREVFARLGKKMHILSEKEWNLYCDIHKKVAWEPDVVIYLSCSTSTCLQRAQQRARCGEDDLSHEYLGDVECFHKLMLRWYNHNSKRDVHAVDASQDTEAVLARVKAILDSYS